MLISNFQSVFSLGKYILLARAQNLVERLNGEGYQSVTSIAFGHSQ